MPSFSSGASTTATSTILPMPSLMLGNRSLAGHGGSGSMSFRQVPYVRVQEQVEKGVNVRKQLKKFYEIWSQQESALSNVYLTRVESCFSQMCQEEISQSCLVDILQKMRQYSTTVGKSHGQTSRRLLTFTSQLNASSKIKKWNINSYNTVQKCVQEVATAERKMEKSILRRETAHKELNHWKRVVEANKATLEAQPNNPDCQKGLQLVSAKLKHSVEEQQQAEEEYLDIKDSLQNALERRDELVTEATELCQIVEEDRMEASIAMLQEFVSMRIEMLAQEQMILMEIQDNLNEASYESVIQQYVVDTMKPELTHRYGKALCVLEWHYKWHLEQQELAKHQVNEQDLLFINSNSPNLAMLKDSGVTFRDIEVMKDFVSSCFLDPDRSIMSSSSNKRGKYRSKFYSLESGPPLYRVEMVRRVMMSCLNHQRAFSQYLSPTGYEQLSQALLFVLDVCMERNDTKTAQTIMNMAQTFCVDFSRVKNSKKKEVWYMLEVLQRHPIWKTGHYWGDTLLIGIGNELSKNPTLVPWHHLSTQERTQQVQQVHNVIYGQLSTQIYNMKAFGVLKKETLHFMQEITFAFELNEDQRINLYSTVLSCYESVEEEPNDLQEETERSEDVDDSDSINSVHSAALFAIAILPGHQVRSSNNSNNRLNLTKRRSINPFGKLKEYMTSNTEDNSTIAGTPPLIPRRNSLKGPSTEEDVPAVLLKQQSSGSSTTSKREEENHEVDNGEASEDWEDLFGGDENLDAASTSTSKSRGKHSNKKKKRELLEPDLPPDIPQLTLTRRSSSGNSSVGSNSRSRQRTPRKNRKKSSNSSREFDISTSPPPKRNTMKETLRRARSQTTIQRLQKEVESERLVEEVDRSKTITATITTATNESNAPVSSTNNSWLQEVECMRQGLDCDTSVPELEKGSNGSCKKNHQIVANSLAEEFKLKKKDISSKNSDFVPPLPPGPGPPLAKAREGASANSKVAEQSELTGVAAIRARFEKK